MTEEWKDIPGFEGYYQVSNLGRIKSVERWINHRKGKTRVRERLKKYGRMGPYYGVTLSKEGNNKTVLVHRIVALCFIANPDNKPKVNHKDFNVSNNCVNNLEWATQQENIDYSVAANRNVKGETHGCHKLTEVQVKEIRSYDKAYKWLSDHYGVSYGNIKLIRNRKIWAHI